VGSVIVTTETLTAWPRVTVDHIEAADFSFLTGLTPAVEILLLGCGARAVPISAALRASVRDLGLGLDFMDTGAACRTFNVLVQEDRRVAAALIAVA
jgi:uncharacterized protein